MACFCCGQYGHWARVCPLNTIIDRHKVYDEVAVSPIFAATSFAELFKAASGGVDDMDAMKAKVDALVKPWIRELVIA